MSEHDPHDNESIDTRAERALTECMTVLPEGGEIYTVVGENGATYTVDRREGRCTCPDHAYRSMRCKHLHRVAYATGDRPVPTRVDGVDNHLGEHTDATPQVAATDGGLEHRTPRERTRVPVAGGVLVYEREGFDRELVGFADVTDWNDVRSALAARGHSVGAIHHLPELE